MRQYLVFLIIIFHFSAHSQIKFKVVETETESWKRIYTLVDENNSVLKILDSTKFTGTWNVDNYNYFAVMNIINKKSKGWPAIDANGDIIFYVYNKILCEVEPDFFVEDKIRIIDENGKIGFANVKGEIIIKPQFENVSTFYKGFAIISADCEEILYENQGENSDQLKYIKCKKFGYIDQKGNIIKIGDFTFDEIKNEIGWRQIEPGIYIYE